MKFNRSENRRMLSEADSETFFCIPYLTKSHQEIRNKWRAYQTQNYPFESGSNDFSSAPNFSQNFSSMTSSQKFSSFTPKLEHESQRIYFESQRPRQRSFTQSSRKSNASKKFSKLITLFHYKFSSVKLHFCWNRFLG